VLLRLTKGDGIPGTMVLAVLFAEYEIFSCLYLVFWLLFLFGVFAGGFSGECWIF
jgi:hypothetical protein